MPKKSFAKLNGAEKYKKIGEKICERFSLENAKLENLTERKKDAKSYLAFFDERGEFALNECFRLVLDGDARNATLFAVEIQDLYRLLNLNCIFCLYFGRFVVSIARAYTNG